MTPLGCGKTVLLVLFAWLATAWGPGHAEVTLDKSFGPGGTVTGPNYDIKADLGHQQGINLFHSFETFNVDTGDLTLANHGSIEAATVGSGNGGNITIDPTFVVLDNTSKIVADAFQGSGGNIGIVADYYLAWPDALVDASSKLGIQGTVEIDSPNIDLSGVLAVLSESGEIPEMNRDSCATRDEEAVSSLVVSGRGGLPPGPAIAGGPEVQK